MKKENCLRLLFLKDIPYIVVDTESTSFNPNDIYGKLTEIGAVKMVNGQIVDKFSQLIDPECSISRKITEVTHITNEMVKGCPTYPSVLKQFKDFCGTQCVLVMHNAPHDMAFFRYFGSRCGCDFDCYPILDTLTVSKKIIDKDALCEAQHSIKPSFKLEDLCHYFGINDPSHHRAWNDAYVTAQLMSYLKDMVVIEMPQYNVAENYFDFIDNNPKNKSTVKKTIDGTKVELKPTSLKVRTERLWQKDVGGRYMQRIYFNILLNFSNGRCEELNIYYDLNNQSWGTKNTSITVPAEIFNILSNHFMKRHGITSMDKQSVLKVMYQ